MKQAVRAIVVKGNDLLVMKRNKFGDEYYTLIGGAVEEGETREQALLREVKEETGLQINNPCHVITEEAGEPFGTQYVYLCQYGGGEPKLSADADEAAIHKQGDNLYEPMWLPLSHLANVSFRSELLKKTLLRLLKKGFPNRPLTLR